MCSSYLYYNILANVVAEFNETARNLVKQAFSWL